MTYRYKTIKIDGRTRLLHRHLMEQKIGRPLARNEHVHHVNGDEHDNRPENLELIDHQKHMALHKQKHPLTKTCAWCGATFTPNPTKRARAKCCSPEHGALQCKRTRREMNEARAT